MCIRDRHYTGSPVCAPSRYILLTGNHSGHAYIRGNYELGGYEDTTEGGQMPIPKGTPTLGTLLKEQGYKVIGLFMQNWQSEPGEICTSEIDFKDASEVCDKLNIPLHRANFSNQYWDKVFEEFLREHKAGRTPNPDILCNREIKFKSFLEYAIDIGADYIATGHYASLKKIDGINCLCRAKDINKDQTYFLHEVKESEFNKCIFPLENLLKNEVRKIASDIKLSVSKKKDSVGICFVGERNMKDFLGRFITLKKGNILDDTGSHIGSHSGATLYTRGQRQGLKVGGIKGKDDLPWYCLLYTSPSPRDATLSRMPSSA